jgi:zinc protease
LLAGTIVAGAAPATAQQANGWGVPYTDVTPDPSIRYGTLPNGMKYAIMRNALPKGAGVVRLRFEFGSIGEREDERGLAHFIEHMAFNGSTHVAEGEMVKILERKGLKFGPDTNAVTSFDTTTYMLDLPQADDDRLDTAFMLMREIASEIRFDPAAVDRERGVVLGEKRVRDTYQLHQVEDQIGFQMPGTPYPSRIPIGLESVLKTAPAERLKDLYHRYYQPRNATLVFVGDADPALIEKRIIDRFSDWKAVGGSSASLPRGTVDLNRGAEFDSFTDPAVATTVNLTSFRPWQQPADTLAERRRNMARALAAATFNRRIQRLAAAPDSIVLGGGLSENDAEGAALGVTLKLVARDGAWKPALQLAEQELRRALNYGFNASELKTQKADMLGLYKKSVEQSEARSHQSLANTLLTVVGKPQFVTTPAFRLAYFMKSGIHITPAEATAAFREMWSGSAPLIHVSAREAISPPVLAAAFAESGKIEVTAPTENAAVAFGYAKFGDPGKVVEDRRIDDLGIRTVRFANNVRLNIKRTDFEKGKIAFSARLAGGSVALPREQPGLATMLSSTASMSGTRKHSLDEIRTILAGHDVSSGWTVQADAFVSSGTTSAKDLGLQMKLSAAYLTDPGYRPEAATQWKNVVPIVDKQLSATPGSVMSARVPGILASNDWRFGVPPTSELQKRNFGDAGTLLAPIVAHAPIEIGIVGDVDEAAAIKAVAESFGALPSRLASQAPNPAARTAHFRTDTAPILLTHSGGADQALVGAAWPTDDDRDFPKEVGLAMLGQVMDLMLTESVREGLGDSYGVSVGSTMSDVYAGFGYMMVNSVVAPDKVDEVESAFDKVARSLRDQPVSDDLLARARAPMLENATKETRQNAYWLRYVDEAQSEADRLDRIRTRDRLIRSVTAAELQALARQYLADNKTQRIRILSDKLQIAQAPAAGAAAKPD